MQKVCGDIKGQVFMGAHCGNKILEHREMSRLRVEIENIGI